MKKGLESTNSIYKYSFYLILVGLVAYALFSIHSSTKELYWDFPNYYVSSKLLAEGESVDQFYDNDWFNSKANQMGIERVTRFNPFPPITSVLMLPLSSVSPLMAKQVWVFVNVIFLIVTIRLVSKVFSFDYLLSSFFVLLSGASLALNFRLGQFYLMILLLLILSYQAYKNEKLVGSALLLSAITIIKYFPIIFITGFLKRKYLVSFGVSLMALILVQWALFGTDTMQTYFGVLKNHLNGDIDGQGQHPVAFQSFNSFYANVFIANPKTGLPPLLDWATGKVLFQWVTLLLIGSSALYGIKKIYHKKEPSDFIKIIIGMAALTTLPASAPYHFILLLFPFLLLLKHQLRNGRPKESLISIFLFTGVCNASFISVPNLGIPLLDLILDYPRLWFMSALYICSLRLILKNIEESSTKTSNEEGLSYQNLIPNLKSM